MVARNDNEIKHSSVFPKTQEDITATRARAGARLHYIPEDHASLGCVVLVGLELRLGQHMIYFTMVAYKRNEMKHKRVRK